VIADVPDADDFAAGHLLAGAAGRLFDAMLAAIGLARRDIRLASIALTRPPAGRIEGADSGYLVDMARHHTAIARPQNILLLGQQSCALLTGEGVSADGVGQRQINHSGANTAASAIHHPRLLLKQPLLKRSAWTALKRLKELKLT
jgi:DNA polymerase